jgi:hypothetical protein
MTYNDSTAETTADEIGVSKEQKADNRRCAVFSFSRPSALAGLQWPGCGGGAFGLAGFLLRRYANLVMCPVTTIGVVVRVTQPAKGGRTMLRHIPAHPEHQQSLVLALINEALRDAATAPTYQDALDITGDTLRILADMVRTEVRP